MNKLHNYRSVCDAPLLLEDRLRLLNILLTQAPFILQGRIKTGGINIRRPPLTPARQKDLLRISGQILSLESAENILGTCRPLAISYHPAI
jgi:hypothetical protein